jgi:hypothetical protein
MGQGRSQSGRRVRVVARSLAVVAALGVFSAAAAYAHGGLPKAGRAGALHVSTSGTLGLEVGAADLAPGDVVARTATLENRGKGPLGAISLAVRVAGGSGLQIRVDRCSAPWTARTGAALRCPGRASEVVGWRPLAASRSPWQLGSLRAKSSDSLRVSRTLPTGAPAGAAGRGTTIDYRFTAQ